MEVEVEGLLPHLQVLPHVHEVINVLGPDLQHCAPASRTRGGDERLQVQDDIIPPRSHPDCKSTQHPHWGT